jgi:hypothetical protein
LQPESESIKASARSNFHFHFFQQKLLQGSYKLAGLTVFGAFGSCNSIQVRAMLFSAPATNYDFFMLQ